MVDWIPDVQERISSIANAAAIRLGIDCYIASEDVVKDGNYVGRAYEVPTPESSVYELLSYSPRQKVFLPIPFVLERD
jgi:hypothetical protein